MRMKYLIVFIVMISSIFAKRFSADLSIGQNFWGQMKISHSEFKKEFNDFDYNYKLSFSYKVYPNFSVLANIGYEEYKVPYYNGTYTIIPLSIGTKIEPKARGNFQPYLNLSFGANVLRDVENIDILAKGFNGFGEINLGLLYKNNIFLELAYKHHAFTYRPTESENKFYNGQSLGLNLGLRI